MRTSISMLWTPKCEKLLIYNLGNTALEKMVDTIYPYEFSIHIPDAGKSLKFSIESEDFKGNRQDCKEFELKN